MNTALQPNFSYDQVLYLVRQLPKQEKIKLSEELEKEEINSKLTLLLKSFKTKDLSLKTINQEVEVVRKKIYDSQKS